MTKRQYIPVDIAEVRRGVESGKSSREIAAAVGSTSRSIYRLCDKADIPIRGRQVYNYENIDTVISKMSAEDARDYLLEAFKQVTGQSKEIFELGDYLGLSPTESALFGLLYKNVGKCVTFSKIVSFLDLTQDRNEDRNTLNVARTHITHMRRKLKDKYLIRCKHGHGYVLEPVQLTMSQDQQP